MKRYSNFIVVIGLIWLGSCAYYNTFYNARQYYAQGLAELEKSSDGAITANVRKYFDTAIEKSNKVLLNYPESRWNDDAAYLIAMSQYYKTDYIAAKKSFEYFFATFPASELRSRAEIWYGRCLWKMGEKENALYQLRKSSQKEKKPLLKAEIYFAMADLFMAGNDLDSALYYYRHTVSTAQDNPLAAEAQYHIAEINLKRNNIDQAITDLKRIVDYSPTEELIDKMQVLLARIYRESGRFDEARELINAKLNDIANESIWGELELQLGLLYLAENDYKSAESRFSQVAEKYPNTPIAGEAHYLLGQLYLEHFKNLEKAQSSFEAVRRADRNSKYALDAQSKATDIKRYFTLQSKYREVYKNVQPFLEKIEGGVDIAAVDVDIEEVPEKLKKAIQLFEEEKAKIADTVSVFKNYYQVLYEIGEMNYFEFNNIDSALVYFERIHRQDYFNPIRDKALYAVYYLMRDIGQNDAAEAYLDTMKTRFQESPYLQYIQGQEVRLPGDNIQARQLFLTAEQDLDFQPRTAMDKYQQVIRQYPNSRYAEKSMLAIAWLYQHRFYDLDKSIEWYEKFQAEYPESEYGDYAGGELAKLNQIVEWINKSAEDSLQEGEQAAIPDDESSTSKPVSGDSE
ncbi:MAG TPA: tetratricopeptide repeat protein [Candidatus Marinimicrobia bacterium]|nr:tetratricopeptide repeat protein [Candidatus Neomarinimicrobiota bacterium]